MLEPLSGSVFPRDHMRDDGTFVAPVTFTAEVDAARVEWRAEGTYVLGDGAPPDFALTFEYRGDGDRWVEAVAFDQAGAVIGSATVDFSITPPPAGDCEGMLDALGVEYVDGPPSEGVATPVTVTLPIAGIAYRYVSNTSQRQTWMMDCELAAALHHAASLFSQRGITEIADYGIYNYRCIDQTVDPPDCPGSSLSMHAHALAIDIAGITSSDGTYYSVKDDFVIDSDGDTCNAPTENEKDAFLHEIFCALHDDHVFNILLSPNYNESHRDHFHLDLTPGADFIRREAPGL